MFISQEATRDRLTSCLCGLGRFSAVQLSPTIRPHSRTQGYFSRKKRRVVPLGKARQRRQTQASLKKSWCVCSVLSCQKGRTFKVAYSSLSFTFSTAPTTATTLTKLSPVAKELKASNRYTETQTSSGELSNGH